MEEEVVGRKTTDEDSIQYINFLKVVYDWWQINWSDHVLLNINVPAPKTAINFTDDTQQWSSIRWEKLSPQISTKNVSATDPIDKILLKSKIHAHFINSYCTQLKQSNMSCKELSQLLVLVNEAMEIITNSETTTNLMRKWHFWWIYNCWMKMKFN